MPSAIEETAISAGDNCTHHVTGGAAVVPAQNQHMDEFQVHVPRDKDCRLVHLLSHSGSSAGARNTTTDYFHGDYNIAIQPVEILLIILLLVFWASTIAVFLRRWRSIRILQPGEPRFKHAPKNLESIKIVTKHRESVIYNNYSENIAKTMQARQKRLDRMNTMPNIKVGELFPLTPIDETRRCASIDMEPLHQNGSSSSSAGEKGRDSSSLARIGNSCVQSLAQSCTSIVVSFHSNSVISPVIEVEELEENEEDVFDGENNFVGPDPLTPVALGAVASRPGVPAVSDATSASRSLASPVSVVPISNKPIVPTVVALGADESIPIDEDLTRRRAQTLPSAATRGTVSIHSNRMYSDL